MIVLVPTEEDWEDRLEQREEAEGEDVPESVMLEMKGSLCKKGLWEHERSGGVGASGLFSLLTRTFL